MCFLYAHLDRGSRLQVNIEQRTDEGERTDTGVFLGDTIKEIRDTLALYAVE